MNPFVLFTILLENPNTSDIPTIIGFILVAVIPVLYYVVERKESRSIRYHYDA